MNLKKEFKMTKLEKILTVILLAILVAYGYYQTVYATSGAFIRDYKHGYKLGVSDYNECRAQTSCRPTLPEQVNTVIINVPGGIRMDESPYAHGYHNGWVKACLNDGGWANCNGWHDGGLMIAGYSGPGHCDATGCESSIGVPVRQNATGNLTH
jgi:hypothetical protein